MSDFAACCVRTPRLRREIRSATRPRLHQAPQSFARRQRRSRSPSAARLGGVAYSLSADSPQFYPCPASPLSRAGGRLIAGGRVGGIVVAVLFVAGSWSRGGRGVFTLRDHLHGARHRDALLGILGEYMRGSTRGAGRPRVRGAGLRPGGRAAARGGRGTSGVTYRSFASARRATLPQSLIDRGEVVLVDPRRRPGETVVPQLAALRGRGGSAVSLRPLTKLLCGFAPPPK